MIPGLENAEFARLGVMHRQHLFIESRVSGQYLSCCKQSQSILRGQMTGVEGYVESAASGLLAGINMAYRLHEKEAPRFSGRTAIGAMDDTCPRPTNAFSR